MLQLLSPEESTGHASVASSSEVVKEKGRSLLLFSLPSFMLLHCFYPLLLALFVTMILSPGNFSAAFQRTLPVPFPKEHQEYMG